MNRTGTFALMAVGLALACAGQPIRSYVGIGGAFPNMHRSIRQSVAGRGGASRYVGQARRSVVRPHGPVVHNVYWDDDSLHRPWAGSISYERKKDEAAVRSAFLQVKQETQSMLRQINAEADMERRRQASERRQAEQRQELAAAKAEVQDQRRQKAAAHQAFLQEQTDEIRRRATEQESLRARRLAEQEAEYDRIKASLKPCRAYNDDGSPCKRKANPGLRFCYRHVGYAGQLQPPEEASPVVAAATMEVKASEPVSEYDMAAAGETSSVERRAEARSEAARPVVVREVVAEGGGGFSFERTLALLAVVLALLVCFAVLGSIMFAGTFLFRHLSTEPAP